MRVQIVNLEEGMPPVDEAMEQLNWTIATRKKDREAKCLLIIHGYGSHGVGGAIRERVRKRLVAQRSREELKLVVFGENFNPCDKDSQILLDQFPELKTMTDYFNHGVTIVTL